MTIDRHAVEVRLLLDFVTYEFHRLGPKLGTPVRVVAGMPDLSEELADRLWPDHEIDPHVISPFAIYLLSVEQNALPRSFAADHVLIAFRNSMSHKRLLHNTWRGTAFVTLERRLARTHQLVASRGIMGPVVMARVLMAAAVSRQGHYGRGFNMRDRALLSPSGSGAGRYVSPFGLLVGSRRR